MRLLAKSLLACAIAFVLASPSFAAKPKPVAAPKPLVKIVFATDWKAQAEHGWIMDSYILKRTPA